MDTNTDLILNIFRAIEERDAQRFLELCIPDLELCWPPALPYGVDRGSGDASAIGSDHQVPTWTEVWDPLQPNRAERRMDPRVVGASDNSVVVLWHQRGLDKNSSHIDEEVLALYEIRDRRLARAKMFYFDPGRVAAFLTAAAAP